jgi:hypothetical protein
MSLIPGWVKPSACHECNRSWVWSLVGSNQVLATSVIDHGFDPWLGQTKCDLLHSWQVLGLTQPGIKPMIYYTHGKHLVWPNLGSNPWSITLMASTWFDPTRDQTHDLLHSWQAHECNRSWVWSLVGSNQVLATSVIDHGFDPWLG